MARARQANTPEKSTDALDRIADAVEKLAGEVELIRGIIDRLQYDFSWALNNDAFRREDVSPRCGSLVHVTSMPLDPLAEDWNERLNRFGPEDIDDSAEPIAGEREPVQRDLFSR